MNPKIIETLIDKIKLTPVQAVWVISLSEKHALWIANQLVAKPDLYPHGSGNIKKIMRWKKNNPETDIGEYTYKTALEAIEESEKSFFKRTRHSLKNENIVAVCEGSEYKWVELKTTYDCYEEGRAMRHCLKDRQDRQGGYIGIGKRIFSLRDLNNRPCVTLQIDNGKIGQYVTSGNQKPDEFWNKYFKFLEDQAKLNVSVSSKYAHCLTKERPVVEKKIKGDLCIEEGFSVKLPEGFEVSGSFTIEDDEIKLPKGLKVGKDLIIRNGCYSKLPDGTFIGRNLLLSSGVLVEIDFKKIKLCGKIIFE